MEGSILLRRFGYAILIIAIMVCSLMYFSWLSDPRRDFNVVGLNIRNVEISNAKASYGDYEFDWGWLLYGETASYSGVYAIPPKVIRVRWSLGQKNYDRTITIIGGIPKNESNSKISSLLIQIDPICERAKAIWESFSDNTPYPAKEASLVCTGYDDVATPKFSRPQ